MITAQDDRSCRTSPFGRAGCGQSGDPICADGARRALLVYLQAWWQGEILGGARVVDFCDGLRV